MIYYPDESGWNWFMWYISQLKVVDIGLSDILSQWKWLALVLVINYPNESGWHMFKWYNIPMKVVGIGLSEILSQWMWLSLA